VKALMQLGGMLRALDNRDYHRRFSFRLLRLPFNGAAPCRDMGQSFPQNFDFASSPILTMMPDGRDVLLAGQKSGMVYALDPARKGEILWQTRVGRGGTNGGVQWGMTT